MMSVGQIGGFFWGFFSGSMVNSNSSRRWAKVAWRNSQNLTRDKGATNQVTCKIIHLKAFFSLSFGITGNAWRLMGHSGRKMMGGKIVQLILCFLKFDKKIVFWDKQCSFPELHPFPDNLAQSRGPLPLPARRRRRRRKHNTDRQECWSIFLTSMRISFWSLQLFEETLFCCCYN